MTFAKVKKRPCILTYLYYNWLSASTSSSESKDAIVSEKSTVNLFPLEKPMLCRKINQGQSRVLNLTNYDGQECLMLHSKFCGKLFTGTREEDF